MHGRTFLREAGVHEWGLDAEVLLAAVLERERWWLLAHGNDQIYDHAINKYRELLGRRAAGEPVSQILGRREFWSLELEVDSSVLTPRPETELLVEKALEIGKRRGGRGLRILDLGTGSGAIAVALAKEFPDAVVVATDISLVALTVARRNARRHGVEGRVSLVVGWWLEPLSMRGGAPGFDMVVTNPPYVSLGEWSGLAREVKEWEPTTALLGGDDGLDPLREIVEHLDRVVSQDAWFLCEIGSAQGKKAVEIVASSPLVRSVELFQDLAGCDRVVVARLAQIESVI